MSSVKSSQIKFVGFDAKSSTLAVKFQRGEKIYFYPNFTEKQYQDFIGAESLGKHFAANIKNLPFTKFEGAKK